jgi:hypothetical protein
VAVLLHHGDKRKLYRDDTQLDFFKVFTLPRLCKHRIAAVPFCGYYADGSLAKSTKIGSYKVDENGVRKTK